MEQHVLIEFELDPGTVEELASGRTGGWLGRNRPPSTGSLGWRTFVRPIWPLVLLLGVLIAGVRAVSVIPAELWLPVFFDLLRLGAIAVPVGYGLGLLFRRMRRR